MTEQQNLAFLTSLLAVIDQTVKSFPADDLSIRKWVCGSPLRARHSDFCVKTLSLLFNVFPQIITNSAISENMQWEGGLVHGYIQLLSLLLPQLTFFPLLMKSVFNASLMVCNSLIRGFDVASFDEIRLFIEFMLPSLERFE